MIQASHIKNIEPKAAVKAKGATEGKAKKADLESMLDNADFENELKAAGLNDETAEPKVKPVVVAPSMLMESPSKLIKLPEASPDAVSPKVFDPALTQGVDSMVGPASTEVELPVDAQLKLVAQEQQAPVELSNEQILKLANGEVPEVEAEIAQAMLKTPQVQEQTVAGRSPALDMAKAEIDPQLMNMDDFVAQKNLAVKKSLNNSSAYGMPNKAAVNGKVAAMESDLKSTQVINELGAKSSESGSMNSQQFILAAQADLNTNAQAVNETQAPAKVFNMSHVKTENPNQIMSQITDYIVQAKAAKEPTVNMRVNHEELGMIDIRVQKSGVGQETIAINIGTHSVDGKNFFQANSKDLFSHLTSTGLNVTDLKVETPTQTAKNDFDFGSQSGRGGQPGADKQFGSEQNQRRHDSSRRQELWDLLKDNKEAA
jgi:hypothetical protein